MGIAQSAVFISLQAVIAEPSHLAPAISFMYLTSTIGLTIGVPLANAVTQTVLRRRLGKRLLVLGLKSEEVRKVSTVSLQKRSPAESLFVIGTYSIRHMYCGERLL
jgi:hypothetical protein